MFIFKHIERAMEHMKTEVENKVKHFQETQGFLTTTRSQGETRGTNSPLEPAEGTNAVTLRFQISGLLRR